MCLIWGFFNWSVCVVSNVFVSSVHCGGCVVLLLFVWVVWTVECVFKECFMSVWNVFTVECYVCGDWCVCELCALCNVYVVHVCLRCVNCGICVECVVTGACMWMVCAGVCVVYLCMCSYAWVCYLACIWVVCAGECVGGGLVHVFICMSVLCMYVGGVCLYLQLR